MLIVRICNCWHIFPLDHVLRSLTGPHMSGAGLGPGTGWIPWPVLVISSCWRLTQLTLRLTMATRDLEAKRREAEGSGDAFQGEPVQVSWNIIFIFSSVILFCREKLPTPELCFWFLAMNSVKGCHTMAWNLSSAFTSIRSSILTMTKAPPSTTPSPCSAISAPCLEPW